MMPGMTGPDVTVLRSLYIDLLRDALTMSL